MRLNRASVRSLDTTHEGAPVARMTDEQALRRSVMSCLLWEREFYEDGEEIVERIVRLGLSLKPSVVASLAIEARQNNLRHVPLLLLSVLAQTGRGSGIVSTTIENVIQRSDELGEFLVIHAQRNKVAPSAIKPTLSAQIKKGLARAFSKFDEYQLAKYDRDSAIKMRDVLFLVHAKPRDQAQYFLWNRLINNTLATPDTWEVSLSAGEDKRESFERLLREHKLGYLALLRNLRNMVNADVDSSLINRAILARKGAHRVLPFRYVAAARAAPQYEPVLDRALCATIGEMRSLPGKTIVLVDVSGSMDTQLSRKSDMTRLDAAAALGAIVNGDVRLFTFSNKLVEVPPRRGMSGIDVIVKSQSHQGTQLGTALAMLPPTDRLIVITDEQSHDHVHDRPSARHAYMINVASNRNGVGYGEWVHIDGFSENVLTFIHEYEATSY